MSKNNQVSNVLHITPDLDSLRNFVKVLYIKSPSFPIPTPTGWVAAKVEYRSTQTELRRLVKAWFDSGPNVSKLFDENPDLARNCAIHAQLIPTKTPQAKLAYVAAPKNMSPLDKNDIAYGWFFDFLLNPFNERLGGPCRNCERYFVKRTNRKDRPYCSTKCGKLFTSRVSNRNRRKKRQTNQLQVCKQAIAGWRGANSKLTWKEWVLRKTTISKTWLTRAINSGEIPEPRRSGVRAKAI